jgi:hypothetical protein
MAKNNTNYTSSVARSNFVKIPMKAQKIPRFRVFSQKIPRPLSFPGLSLVNLFLPDLYIYTELPSSDD